ncbi:MAG: DNA polymerase I [Firmicutes bacterium]|nr:DNA polymerase I [Bacillota bacterium]
MHIDTLSMARVIDGPKAGNSLYDLCLRHGIGTKGDFVTYAKGKRLADFSRDELHQYGQYCCNDVDRTYDLAQKFLPLLPADELKLIDLTIRMFTEPVFVGDVEKLQGAVASERQRKIELLRRIGMECTACHGHGTTPNLFNEPATMCKTCGGLGVDKKPVGSNEQFAALLRGLGVEPETKPSPTSGEPIYAFARTDGFMQSCLEDPDEEVRFLAEARIGVKSNIIETRAQRFLSSASRGPMPIYLSHAGAHTLRPSGGDSMNFLNMSNEIGGAPRPEMAVLKQSIQVPPGFKIVAADSAQGEVRILAWLAGQHDLLTAFMQGRDVYNEFATEVYGRPIDRKRVKADYTPGFVGKVCILSFGFGAGWFSAAQTFLKGALGAPPIQFKQADMEALGVDPSPFLNSPYKVAQVEAMPSRLELTDRLIHCLVSEALVQRYRRKYQAITGKYGFWGQMEQVINAMIDGREMTFGAHGVFRTAKERIHGPTGLWLDYRGIGRDSDGEATYWDGRKRTKIYGSLLTENIAQHTHRLIVSEQMLEIADTGIKIALWPYDEVVCVVPETAAELSLQFMVSVMKQAPAWAPGLFLAAEGGIGVTYAGVK